MKPAGIVALCKMSVPEVFRHVQAAAGGMAGGTPGGNALRGKRYLYIPGAPSLPLLVAHADTVHEKRPKLIVYDKVRNALSSPQGLGADDRAGVYALLQIWAAAALKPGLLICDEEEWGAIGAGDAARDLGKQLSTYPFFLEVDRRGKGEAVFYNGEPSLFRLFIKEFGFKEHHGCFSDISVLGERAGKCSVNLSAGYYDCHTLKESLVLHHLDATIKKVERILKDCQGNPARAFALPAFPPKGKGKKWKKGRKDRRWYSDLYDWNGEDSAVSWGPNYREEGAARAMAEAYLRRVDESSFEYKICDFCGVMEEVSNTVYGRICARCYAQASMQ